MRDINSHLGMIVARLEDRISNRCPTKSQHVNIVPSDDADDSRVIEGLRSSRDY